MPSFRPSYGEGGGCLGTCLHLPPLRTGGGGTSASGAATCTGGMLQGGGMHYLRRRRHSWAGKTLLLLHLTASASPGRGCPTSGGEDHSPPLSHRGRPHLHLASPPGGGPLGGGLGLPLFLTGCGGGRACLGACPACLHLPGRSAWRRASPACTCSSAAMLASCLLASYLTRLLDFTRLFIPLLRITPHAPAPGADGSRISRAITRCITCFHFLSRAQPHSTCAPAMRTCAAWNPHSWVILPPAAAEFTLLPQALCLGRRAARMHYASRLCRRGLHGFACSICLRRALHHSAPHCLRDTHAALSCCYALAFRTSRSACYKHSFHMRGTQIYCCTARLFSAAPLPASPARLLLAPLGCPLPASYRHFTLLYSPRLPHLLTLAAYLGCTSIPRSMLLLHYLARLRSLE